MKKPMPVTISSLGDVVLELDADALQAEDASGRFGILPGHADFLTMLTIGVVSVRSGAREHHCAVRGGVLSVRDGAVAIATREAIVDDDLDHLEHTVLRELRRRDDTERHARTESTRVELRAMRQLLRALAPGGPTP